MRADPTHDRGRPGERAASNVNSNGDTSTVGQTADHFMHRLLLDVMFEETRAYWLRRAETFDKLGTPACREIAQACRNRAAMTEFDDFAEVVAQVVREVA